MREVKIKSSKNYSAYTASGISSLTFLLDTFKMKKCFIITDDNVYSLYQRYFDLIKERVIGIRVIKNGEESKNINVVLDIYGELINSGANRKTPIIAIGGGVVGDIAGFAAATFMRGVPLVNIPTTLMAQCDSSIGGKNGFNYKGIKNLVGTFYQPEFVYADVNFLKTLNDREYKNGLAEVIKYGAIYDEGLFNFLENNKKGIIEREVDKLLFIVSECIKSKASIVEKDEFDSGIRNILNYGHTIGHGIESALEFNIPHGEAVAIGMIVESLIALKAGYLDSKSFNRIISLIKELGLPVSIDNISIKDIMEYIKKDKKNTSNNVKFVLPDKIGHAIITTEIKQNIIADAIEEVIRRKLW